MRRIAQRSFAAIAAVLGFAGMASAQYAPTNPYQPIPPIQVQNTYGPYAQAGFGLPQNAQAPSPYLPAQAISAPQQPAATLPTIPSANVSSNVGCSTCGKGASTAAPSPYLPTKTAYGAGLAPVPYGEYCSQCANGCGSLKSDLGFYFGSCKSFFNPCGPIPCNGGCNKCGVYPYGKPYGNGFNTCVYDSYMMH